MYPSTYCKICNRNDEHSELCLLNPTVEPTALRDVHETEDTPESEDIVFIDIPSLNSIWTKGHYLYDRWSMIGYSPRIHIDQFNEEIIITYKAKNALRFVHPNPGGSYEGALTSLKEQAEYNESWKELASCIKYVMQHVERERKSILDNHLPFPSMSEFLADRNWISEKEKDNRQEEVFPISDFLPSDSESSD